MRKVEGYFKSIDGLSLFYRLYLQENARDTLIILHGHGEHIGRYEKFSRYLENEQLSIALFDFRGHGQSEGPYVYVRSYEEFISDVSSFVDFLQRVHNLKPPFFLLGHSNGGLTAVHWAMKNPEKLRALILSSPFLGIGLPAYIIGMNRFFNVCMPKMVYQNPVYPPYLTHNTAEIENYKKDTLIRRKITVSLLHQMIVYIRKIHAHEKIKFSFPVFILMAGLEKVVDPDQTKAFFQKLDVPYKDLKEFPDFYHEIFNELGQEKVFDALTVCIRRTRRLSPQTF